MSDSGFKQIYIPNEKWKVFLDIAFRNSNYFSLTLYTFDFPLSATCEYMLECLKPWRIEKQIRVWGEFDKFFYECNFFTQKIISEIGGIEMLGNNRYLDDLCFYKYKNMWFKNISHERVCFIDSQEEEIVCSLRKANILLF